MARDIIEVGSSGTVGVGVEDGWVGVGDTDGFGDDVGVGDRVGFGDEFDAVEFESKFIVIVELVLQALACQ